MKTSRLLVVLAAAALLGACTGGGNSPSVASSASAGAGDPAGVFRQVAECFRAHGQPNFPDPVQAADGTWGFPPDAERVTVPEDCADVFRQSKALYPNRPKGPVVNAADMEKLRTFARCMRSNDVADWPDPNPDGTFTVPDRLAKPESENLWQPTAGGACKQYAPPNGPDISAPR
ncbi:hypothetical protein [Dactylosporangium sp. CA-139066]|uniref:hypothetical protein n=1 Tax=Dactylosporangium sp. CA-139066 TaxID=3239930 RepID=UPI003D8EF70D